MLWVCVSYKRFITLSPKPEIKSNIKKKKKKWIKVHWTYKITLFYISLDDAPFPSHLLHIHRQISKIYMMNKINNYTAFILYLLILCFVVSPTSAFNSQSGLGMSSLKFLCTQLFFSSSVHFEWEETDWEKWRIVAHKNVCVVWVEYGYGWINSSDKWMTRVKRMTRRRIRRVKKKTHAKIAVKRLNSVYFYEWSHIYSFYCTSL